MYMQVLNDLYKRKIGSDVLNVVADGDTNVGKIYVRLWREGQLVLLSWSGHMNKNLGKHVVKYAAKRGGVKKVKAKCNCPHGTNHRFSPPTKAQREDADHVRILLN